MGLVVVLGGAGPPLQLVSTEIFDKLDALIRDADEIGRRLHRPDVYTSAHPLTENVFGIQQPLQQNHHVAQPRDALVPRHVVQLEKRINFKLREFIVSKAKVELVEPKGLTINFPSIGAPVAIRAEGDEIVVLVRLTLRPRDNVMDVDFDVSTRRDGAAVPSLDEDTSADVSRYWRAPLSV